MHKHWLYADPVEQQETMTGLGFLCKVVSPLTADCVYRDEMWNEMLTLSSSPGLVSQTAGRAALGV